MSVGNKKADKRVEPRDIGHGRLVAQEGFRRKEARRELDGRTWDQLPVEYVQEQDDRARVDSLSTSR